MEAEEFEEFLIEILIESNRVAAVHPSSGTGEIKVVLTTGEEYLIQIWE